ncbi:MAG: (Fe-S)-binding protein [Dehalococcoidales bacterium]
MQNDLIPPGLTYLADNIISRQNILGVSKEQSARWARGLGLPGRAETIFFAGCGYQFSRQLEALMSLVRGVDKSVIGAELPLRFARFQKKLGLNLPGIYSNVLSRGAEDEVKPLEAAVKVLRNLGTQPGYLAEEEPCCGAPLFQAGLQDDFSVNARRAYQKLKSSGVKKIIGIVPYCTHALARLFPRFVDGYDLEVRHFLEVVAAEIPSRKLRFPRKVKVTYHDPCQLVRFLKLIEEPRQILKAIENITLVETDWTHGEWSTCCGGGGGFEAVFPELSQMLAVNRARELAETGAEIIVTHCPGCIIQLKDGLRQLKVEGVEVLDLSQVVAMAMEL